MDLALIEQINKIQRAATEWDLAEAKRAATNGTLAHVKRKKKKSNFLQSKAWKEVRALALQIYGPKCMRCGSEKRPCGDHIKPRVFYPELALEISNLQILCWDCNSEKKHLHETDYREQTYSEGIAILKQISQ